VSILQRENLLNFYEKTMKLSATDTSTSIAELIDDEAVMQEVEAKREANEQSEFEISVGS
jgi:hypothetical protein